MKILITTPNLIESLNISGISTIVSNIIKVNKKQFITFITGRRDKEKRNLKWLFKQFFVLFKFYHTLLVLNISLVHINTALSELSIIRDYFLISLSRMMKIKIVLHIHGGKYLFVKHIPKYLRYFIVKSLKNSNQVIVLSKLEKGIIEESFKIEKINILANSVEIDPTQNISFNTKTNTIVFLGRIVKDKGLDEIVDSFKSLEFKGKDFVFELCGVGPDFRLYDTMLKKTMGDRYIYNGIVSGLQKWDILKKSKIFLLPSYYEGLPMSLLEAMSVGCIPIVTSVGSIPEVIKNGYNGLIVNKYSPKEIENSILKIFNDNSLAEFMSYNSILTVKNNYNMTKYNEQLQMIYNSILLDAN
jgi:glycosyltransferase involved in cell wall biosynthesis